MTKGMLSERKIPRAGRGAGDSGFLVEFAQNEKASWAVVV